MSFVSSAGVALTRMRSPSWTGPSPDTFVARNVMAGPLSSWSGAAGLEVTLPPLTDTAAIFASSRFPAVSSAK